MSQHNIHFDSLLEKNVRVKKLLVGRVEAISERFIVIVSRIGAKYNAPLPHIADAGGNDILPDVSIKEL